jgi:hypothetical protein
LVDNLEGRGLLEELRVDGVYNIKMMPKINAMSGCGVDSSGSEWGSVTGSCEHGNGPLGSLN